MIWPALFEDMLMLTFSKYDVLDHPHPPRIRRKIMTTALWMTVVRMKTYDFVLGISRSIYFCATLRQIYAHIFHSIGLFNGPIQCI